VGFLVFLQGLVIFRLPIRIHVIELWGLACSGVFGLTLRSTFANAAQARQSLTLAGIGLVLFYGVSGLLLRAAFLRFKGGGVAVAGILLLFVHVGLYLAVVRSVVA
jgi:hypothetical protein